MQHLLLQWMLIGGMKVVQSPMYFSFQLGLQFIGVLHTLLKDTLYPSYHFIHFFNMGGKIPYQKLLFSFTEKIFPEGTYLHFLPI